MSNKEMVLDALNMKSTYRDKLELSPFTKFGLEIEMDHVSKKNIDKLKKEYNDKQGYNVHEDTSLKDGGIELSTRFMGNREKNWVELKDLSDYLKRIKPQFERSSLQVNLNCHMSYNELVAFLKFYAYYEDIIYRISRGNDRIMRYSYETYAMSILDRLKTVIKYGRDEMDIVNEFIYSKSFGISLKDQIGKENLRSGINLIEFRTPNGTIDPILWQNYITLFQSMIDFFESDDWIGYHFDIDKVDNNRSDFDLNRAIEFANIVFVSDKEKLLFLKQYIGNRKISSLLLTKKRN